MSEGLAGMVTAARQYFANETKRDVALRGGAGVCIGACSIEMIVDMPGNPVDAAVRVMYMLGLTMMPFRPIPASWVIAVIAAVNELVPWLSRCDESWDLLFVLAVQGYMAVRWSSVTMTLMLSVSALLNYGIYRNGSEFGSFAGSVNLAVLLWLTLFIGVWLRQRRQLNEQRELKRQAENVRHDLQLAMRLHDGMSGELTRMLIVVQEGLVAMDDDDRRRWETVREGIDVTFHELHAVMDFLSDVGCERVETPLMRLAEHIEEVLTAFDRRLHDKGFSGRSMIYGASEAMENPRNRMVIDLLGEIYTNIERYADTDNASYFIGIILSDDRIELTQTNTCARKNRRHDTLGTGNGLRVYQRLIAEQGGSVRYGKDGDTWSLHCMLQLNS